MKHIYLVEDHVIVRNGFKELIEHMGDYQVTGEFDNGKQLINDLKFAPDTDLIIMDLSMPVMDGKETMKWMKDQKIKYPVLILTLDTSDKTIIDLYKSGIRGYLAKTCTAETLKRAIDDILLTGYYHNEMLSNALMKNEPLKNLRNEYLEHLTDKELIFLRHVCKDDEYTYERISELMGVSRRTVDGYRESLFEKLKVKSKTGLVLFAIKHELITV